MDRHRRRTYHLIYQIINPATMTREELLNSINLTEDLIPKGKKNRPGTTIKVSSITIHNTDNEDKGADAKAHSAFVRNTGYYMINGKVNRVSWHYTVDDHVAIRQLPDDETAYHAGPNANSSSIAMEICMNKDINQTVADDRAARLAALLLHDNGLTIEKMVTHKKWTGKECPVLLLPKEKWTAFQAAARGYLEALTPAPLAATDNPREEIPFQFTACPDCGIPAYLLDQADLVATLKETPGGNGKIPRRNINIFKLPGKSGYYFNAAMAIDVDGSPRAYSAGAKQPTALDGPGSVDSGGFESMHIQGKEKTINGVTHRGEGPYPGFYVSRTSLLFKGSESYKTSNFVDAEQIPYVVFPDTPKKFPGVRIGDMAYVIDLKTGKSTHAIFADTNSNVGEASLRVAQNLGRTSLSASNGDEVDRYVYIIFPGTRFTPFDTVPHWPDEAIKKTADKAFEAWGGMDQIRKIFQTA